MTKVCKNCGKSLEGKSPRASFCSNKGRGNCKDRFHNKKPSRSGRVYAGGQPRDVEQDIEDELNFDPSWGAHEDSWQ